MSVELLVADVKKDKNEAHTLYLLYLVEDGKRTTLVERSINEKRILRLAEKYLRNGLEVQLCEAEEIMNQTRTYYDVKLDE